MKLCRLIPPILIALIIFIICFSVVWAAPVPPHVHNVDLTPPRQVTSTCNFSYSFDFDSGQPALITYQNTAGSYAWQNNQFEAWNMPKNTCGSHLHFYLEDVGVYTFAGTITSSFYFEQVGDPGSNGNIWSDIYDCGDWHQYTTAPYSNTKTHALSGCSTGHLALSVCEGYDGDAHWGLDDWTITGQGICYDYYPDQTYDTCATVQDHHFTGVISDAWVLVGNATISSSVLTLNNGDAIAQNIDLESHTDYNAVISVTDTATDTEITLNIILGSTTEPVTITTTGLYTTEFTTMYLAGPLGYQIEYASVTSSPVEIDLTCLYPGGEAAENEQYTCIAPTNGEFDTDDYWLWYRTAAWWDHAKAAFLPYQNVALVEYTDTLTLPALASGEYLLLGFDAKSQTESAIVGGKVAAGGSDTHFYFETYPTYYRYETDLSYMSGYTNSEFYFANVSQYPPEGTDWEGLDNIVLDNVCVFVADRPANLPQPVDDDTWLPYVDFGFNYSSCDDVDGILASFGVNMAQYRADYEAGASVWDPQGWVPWLISAMWVVFAALICWLMLALSAIINTLEFLLNNFINFVSWLVLTILAFRDWLWALAQWFWWSLRDSAQALLDWLIDWAWWLFYTLDNIIDAYFPWLGDIFAWLWESLKNIIDWWWSIITGFLAWLYLEIISFNGIRTIINWLIAGWNFFLPKLGLLISTIVNYLVSIWNNYIAPFLQSLWDLLLSFSLFDLLYTLLVTLATTGWNLIWTFLQWIWENLIAVGLIPLNFYYAFDDSLNSAAYTDLVSCAGDITFWCTFLAGVQLINQAVAHSIFYPIVITGIILSTLWILWVNIKETFFPKIDIR